MYVLCSKCSPPNFASVSSMNSFPNAYSSAFVPSGSFGQPVFGFSPVNGFSPAATSASGNIGSSQLSTGPSSLQTFISTFTDAVRSSPILSVVFDISQTSPKAFADFIHHALHRHAESVGISHPHIVISYATQPLIDNFKVITYPILVRINANAMGKLLLAEGILNDMNAASLALAFANDLESSAKKIVDKSSNEYKFQTLVDGYANFLKSQGLYKREKASAILKFYGDEARIVGTTQIV